MPLDNPFGYFGIQGEGYSYATPETTPIPTPEVADVKTQKYAIASEGEMSLEDIRAQILSGRETSLQEWLAYRRQVALEDARKQVVQRVAPNATPEDLRNIALIDFRQENPEVAASMEFASKMTSSLHSFMPSLVKHPEIADLTERVMSQREVFGNIMAEFEPQLKERTLLGGFGKVFTKDFGGLFVPGLSWYRFKELANKEGIPTSWWKSNNLEEVLQKIHAMPLTEGAKEARRIAKQMMDSGNAYDALTFLEGLQAYSSSERFWNDIDTALDALTIPDAGRLVGRALIGGVALSTGHKWFKPSNLAAATGDLGKAARIEAVERFQTQMEATGNAPSINTIRATAPNIYNPETVIKQTPNFQAEATNRLLQSVNQSVTKVFSTLADSLNVRRIEDTSAALAVGLKEAEDYIRKVYHGINDAIIQIRPIDPSETFTSTQGVEALIGKAPAARVASSHKVLTKYIPQTTNIAYNKFIKSYRGKNTIPFGTLDQVGKEFVSQGVALGDIQRNGIIYRLTQQGQTRLLNQPLPSRVLLNQRIAQAKAGAPVIQLTVGTPSATAFDTRAQAIKHAQLYYQLLPNTYSIKELGDKFVISIVKQVDETSPSVQAALLTELRVAPRQGWGAAISRRMGIAEDLFGTNVQTQKKVAQSQAQGLLDAIAEVATEKIGSLRKESRKDFERFIDAQRRDKTREGRFSKDLLEFETEWQKMFNRAPTEREADAYNHYTLISNNDWVVRNTDRYSKLSSTGHRSFAVSNKTFKATETFLDGKIVDSIPTDARYVPTILLWSSDDLANSKLIGIADIPKNQGYTIIKLTRESGLDVHRIPGFRNTFPGDAPVDYIVTREFKESPLRWNQVPYHPGGHRAYIDDWYVSSAKMSGAAYNGDFNLASARTKLQAQEFVKILEEARKLLSIKDDVGLKQHIRDNFPHGLDEARFRKLYDDGILDIRQPFRIRRTDTTLKDVYSLDRTPGFIDNTRSPHHLDEGLLDTPYMGRRDTILEAVEGTPDNPVVKLNDGGHLLDPLANLTQASNAIARAAFMEDVKIKHAYEFMARFGDLLDIKEPLDAQLNPFRYLVDASFKQGAIDPERLAAAKAYRRAALEYLNIRPETQTAVRTFRDRTLDSVFSRFGEAGAERVEPWLAHRIDDPVKFFRAMAFHKFQGLFNWTTYFVQMSQFTTMAAINGDIRQVGQALAWSFYQGFLPMASSNVSNNIGTKAAAWGSNKQFFQEAWNGWRRSKLDIIGGTTSYLDNFTEQPIIQTATGRFLDFGRTFFDAGERHSRRIAWNMAYLEWRQKNPTAKFTDTVIGDLVQRTDLLTGHMTRANHTYWQKGIMSLPTQFHNWQLRMTEQMLGDSLTWKEKSRLVALNSILYGIPAGVGQLKLVGAGLLPLYDIGDTIMKASGVAINDRDSGSLSSNAMRLMLKGLVPEALKYVTGDEWNVGEKYGPSRQNPIRDVFFGDDKTFLGLAMGASGDVVGSILKTAMPAVYSVLSITNRKENRYEPSFEDMKNHLIQELPALNNVHKALMIMSTGKYFSKTGIPQTELDNWKGIVVGLTGLKPEKIVELQEKRNYIEHVKTYNKLREEKIRENLFKALNAKTLEDHEFYSKRYRSFIESSKLTDNEILRITRGVLYDNADKLDAINQRFMQLGPKELSIYFKEKGQR